MPDIPSPHFLSAGGSFRADTDAIRYGRSTRWN